MTPYHSYKEWREAGFQVMKGERAVDYMSDGTPLFSPDQVKPSTYTDDWYEPSPALQYDYDEYEEDMGDR